jgi:acyl-CoA dehydrogenase
MDEAAWRAEVRAFLDGHASLRTGIDDWSASPATGDAQASAAYFDRCREWQRTLFDNGFAGITWPAEHGGRGGAPWQQAVYREEESRYDVTSGFLTSTITLVGAALLAHGSDAQRARHLRPLLRGDEVWCQLFSEPDAGSDLANLATRAVHDGGEFVVTGQKVWTSGAQHADFGILLARTAPDAPKHRGITCFVLPMHAAGVTVRPLRQITGDAHFNEVFLDAVRITDDAAVGEVDGGWAVARTVLASESAMIGSFTRADPVVEVLRVARANGRAADPVARQEIARYVTRERILGLLRERVRREVRAGSRPSVDGSVLKLLWSQARAARGELGVMLLGAPATADDGTSADPAFWRIELLGRYWGSIGGGTDEIHHTHVAERVLGLPAEPRVDGGPWSAR